jgi:tetratricopeptide (TPR) repeat protein
LRLGRPKEAEDHFARAIELDAACTPAMLGRAEICREAKNNAGALKWYERALAQDGHLFAAHAGIARVLCGEGKSDEAIAHLESEAADSPDNRQACEELIAAIRANRRGP